MWKIVKMEAGEYSTDEQSPSVKVNNFTNNSKLIVNPHNITHTYTTQHLFNNCRRIQLYEEFFFKIMSI